MSHKRLFSVFDVFGIFGGVGGVVSALVLVTFQGIDAVLNGVFAVWQGADQVTDASLQGDYVTFQGDDVGVWEY